MLSLRKLLNSSVYRFDSFHSHLSLINSKYSTQGIKPLEDVKENNFVVNNEKENSSQNKSKDIALTEEELNAIEKVVQKPKDYDMIWEYNCSEEKSYDKITDFFVNEKKGFSTDFIVFLHHKYDFSIQGIKRRFKYYIGIREEYNQRYIPQRHGILGPELATAHFITYRGGKVKFTHSPNVWLNDINQFPGKYDRRYQLLAVDASNVKLRYEAFDNLSMLTCIEDLNLSNNKLLDDWSCDKIARMFRNSTTLSTLNLSNNPLITNRGIETLHRIKSLKKLIITGTKAAQYPFIELLIILFNDINPDCEIVA